MARSSSGAIVAALTAAALGGVGFLAFQAEAAPDRPAAHAGGRGSDTAKDQDKDAGKGGPGGTATGQGGAKAQDAVPEASGVGQRVVYALAQKRIWLVGADEKATRTFEVSPSTVNPPPGTYTVTSRTPNVTGSDGTPVEHVVIFHKDPTGIVFGFSAAVDGSSPNPASTKKTGAIRETPADGTAMWNFAVNKTKVVVIP